MAKCVKVLILQSAARTKFDFLIFTALQKERAPYITNFNLNGEAKSSDGLQRFDIEIHGRSGSVIELPRMGLVDAAITAAKCIEKYSPKIIAMSGICAGFKDKTELGQLLISELAYEYQSGKWSDDGFKSEPYQMPISEFMRSQISFLIRKQDILAQLEEGWRGDRPNKMTDPEMAIFTSGSAVIADKEQLDHVEKYHRKVSGLDMEVYAIHRAAHLSKTQTDVLCAKVVVDLADKHKSDNIQDYGCYVSSNFVIQAIKQYFSN